MTMFRRTRRSDLRHRIVRLGELSHRRKATGLTNRMIRRKRGETFSEVYLYTPVQAGRIFIRI